MKKLTILIVSLLLVASACATGTDDEMTMTEVGTAMTALAGDAEAILADLQGSDAGAELNDVMSVIAADATTVGLAATAGEVSDEDVTRLASTLEDFELGLDEVRGSLDPDLVDRIDSFRSELDSLVDRLQDA